MKTGSLGKKHGGAEPLFQKCTNIVKAEALKLHPPSNKAGVSLGGSMIKNPPVNAGDAGSIPGSGRSPGEGNGNPLQHSCLKNPMDRGAWQATVQSVAKSQAQLSD